MQKIHESVRSLSRNPFSCAFSLFRDPLSIAVTLAGPPELHEQRWKELVWHWASTANVFRSVDYHQGHFGAHQYGWKRGKSTRDLCFLDMRTVLSPMWLHRAPENEARSTKKGEISARGIPSVSVLAQCYVGVNCEELWATVDIIRQRVAEFFVP